jgi:DNA-binding CsgD family transcriptional regulator
MKARERRVAGLALMGTSQAEIARAEAISQSAVSQNLRRSGASALSEALATLGG